MQKILLLLICSSTTVFAQSGWLETVPVVLSHVNHQAVGSDPACEEGNDPKIVFFRSFTDENFNIVLNKEIHYKAKKTGQDNSGWEWEVMNQSGEYVLSAFNGGSLNDVGHTSFNEPPPSLFINGNELPTQSKLPETNLAFGVQAISAKHLATSTTVTATANNKILRSFFVKNEMNSHTWKDFDPNYPDIPAGATEPNWFYYWKQTQPVLDLLVSVGEVTIYDVENGNCEPKPISISSTLRYDNRLNYVPGKEILKRGEFGSEPTYHTVPPSGKWGFHSGLTPEISLGASHPGCPQELSDKFIITGYTASIITLGPGAGMIKPGPGGQIQGINAFYETVAHEVNHALFDATHFGVGGIVEDTDEDGYDDNWERAFNTDPTYSSYVNRGITFSVCPTLECNDKYQPGYSSLGCLNIDTETGIATINEANRAECHSGTLFEELFVREIAKQLLNNIGSDLSNFDWSYDDKKTSVSTENSNWRL